MQILHKVDVCRLECIFSIIYEHKTQSELHQQPEDLGTTLLRASALPAELSLGLCEQHKSTHTEHNYIKCSSNIDQGYRYRVHTLKMCATSDITLVIHM